MSRRLLGLIRKEFAQIFRDRPLVFILLWAFTAAVYTAGQARTADVNDVPTAIFDLSRSPASREFISHLQRPYFKIVSYLTQESEIARTLEDGRATMVVIVPPDFQRKVDGAGQASVQVISDGALAMSATVSIAYVAAISGAYSMSVLEQRAGAGYTVHNLPGIDERLRVRFNPNMLSSWFAGLLELLNMFTMVSLLLTAANLVREKEHGTLEQLLVSPARPIEVFIAKIVPTVVLVLAMSSLSFLLVLVPVFHVPIRGSLFLFYGASALYVFAMTSMGIAIAVVAKNIAQALMIMILILQPMIFLSGAWNPPEAMTPWMRWISMLSPLRYFIDLGYGVILKGNDLRLVATDLAGIVVLGTILFSFSLAWFNRSLR
jgi:ABC-2 type transport system permease protein